MASYTVHLDETRRAGDHAAIADAVLVRDGFSYLAFVFTFLWCVWNRAWLAALLILVADALIVGAHLALGTSPAATLLSLSALNLLIGLESATLKRWGLRRRGYPSRTLVIADDWASAEAKAMAVLSAAAPVPAQPVRSVPIIERRPLSPNQPPERVLGLFPDPEARG